MIPVTKPTLPGLSEYVQYLKKLWSSKYLTNRGELVLELERRLARYLGVRDLVLVANGTLGLHLVVKALGLKGEVITTPFTFAPTTNVLVWEGIKPVFADVDPETFNIDPREVAKKITKKTSAILAVHIFGNPCDIERLLRIARAHHLKLIFDAAHAFGVRYRGQPILRYGDASMLSLHATKVFHTIEGGAVVARNKNLLKKVRLLSNFGFDDGSIELAGINAKMNEFQAAMGLLNLGRVKKDIAERKKRYEYYKKLLGSTPGIRFQKLTASTYNYVFLPVYFETARKRDTAYKALLKQGVAAKKYFDPLTSDARYLERSRAANLAVARRISQGILCLPLYPDLPMSAIRRIVRIIKKEVL